MSIETEDPRKLAARLDEMQRENETLRTQVRRYAAHQVVSRGALAEATHEKDATARIAGMVSAQERATRAAVEVQGTTINAALVLQMLSFLMLVVVTAGLFFWLPSAIESRFHASTVVAPASARTVIIPR